MKPREVQSSWLTTIQAVCSASSGIARPVVALDGNHGCAWVAQDGFLGCQPLPHPQQQAHTASRRPAAALPVASSVRLLSPSPYSKYIAAADEQFLYIIPTSTGTHPSPGGTSSSSSSSRPVASIPAARVKRLVWHPSISGLLAYTVVGQHLSDVARVACMLTGIVLDAASLGQCRASLVQVAEACRPTAIPPPAAATGTHTQHSSSLSDVVSSSNVPASSSSDTATLQWQLHDGYAAAELPAGQFGQHSSAAPPICWVTTTTSSDKQSATSSTLDGSSSSSSNATICGSREGAAGGCCLAAAWSGRVVLYHWQPKGTQAVCVTMQLLVLDCSDPPTQMAFSPAAAALVMTFEAPLALSLSAATCSGSSDTGTSSMLLQPVRPPIVTTVSSSTSIGSKVQEAGSRMMRPAQPQVVVTSSSSQEGIISWAAPASGASVQTSVLDQLMCISLEGADHGSSSSSSREGSTAHVQQRQQQQQEAPLERHQPLVQEVGEGNSAGALGSSVEAGTTSTGSSSSRQQVPSVVPRVAVLPVPSVLGAVAPSHSVHQTPGASVASTPQQQEEDEGQVRQFSSVLPLSQALPDLLQLQGSLAVLGSSTGPAAVQLFHLQAGSCQLQHVGTLLLRPQGWPTPKADAHSSTAGAAGGGPSSRSSSSGYDASLCRILVEVPWACQDSNGSTGTGTGSISRSSAGGSGAPSRLDAGGSCLLHAILRPRGGAPPGGVHFALRTGPAPSNSSCGGGMVGAPQLGAAAAASRKVKCRSSTVELCLATFDLQPILPHTFLTSVAPVEEPHSRQQQHSGGLGGAPNSTPDSLVVARTAPTGAAGVQQTSNSEILQQLLHLQAQVQAGFQGIMQQLQRQEARLAALEALMQREARSTDS